MLEQAALRLLPWMPGADAEARRSRSVCGLGGDAIFGTVRVVRGPSWLGLGPSRWDICETEDAALLMSIEHGWFALGYWHVLDAERGRVGGVVGNHVLDEQGSRFATVWQDPAGGSTIRDRQGKALVRIEAADASLTLHFADDLEPNPFLRMVLLAACALQQMP